jgi:hypothetical protein
MPSGRGQSEAGEHVAARLNSFLDWLRLEAIATRSRLREADADRLAEDVKAGWWGANKAGHTSVQRGVDRPLDVQPFACSPGAGKLP